MCGNIGTEVLTEKSKHEVLEDKILYIYKKKSFKGLISKQDTAKERFLRHVNRNFQHRKAHKHDMQ